MEEPFTSTFSQTFLTLQMRSGKMRLKVVWACETQSCDAPEYALDAAKVFRKLQYLGGIDEVDLLDTAAIVKSRAKSS